jgi:hypothetical protein
VHRDDGHAIQTTAARPSDESHGASIRLRPWPVAQLR